MADSGSSPARDGYEPGTAPIALEVQAAAHGGPVFSRVAREPRLSDKVASRILEVIVETPLRPGESLPSERALGDQFGVSRTVIREALRSLAGKGVVEMTQGRRLRVARVERSNVRESIHLFLKGRPALDYGRVHEVRALLETEIAGLAAERATDADLAALADACERLAAVPPDADSLTEADVAFHRVLARSAHNELFVVMLDAIDAPLMEIRLETFGTVSHRAEIALAAHRAILREVAAHHVERARAVMHEHLDEVLLAWRQMRMGLDELVVPPVSPAAPGATDGRHPAAPDGWTDH